MNILFENSFAIKIWAWNWRHINLFIVREKREKKKRARVDCTRLPCSASDAIQVVIISIFGENGQRQQQMLNQKHKNSKS